MQQKQATTNMALAANRSPIADDESEQLDWPEAIARLAAERTRAVTCAGKARALGEAGAGLAAAYGEAKAEIDGVIAGLSVALIEGQPIAALNSLQHRLEAGLSKREAFCRAVMQRSGPEPAGARSIAGAVLVAAVKPLIDAFGAIVRMIDERDRLRRVAVRTQLEATRWPDFGDISPAN